MSAGERGSLCERGRKSDGRMNCLHFDSQILSSDIFYYLTFLGVQTFFAWIDIASFFFKILGLSKNVYSGLVYYWNLRQCDLLIFGVFGGRKGGFSGLYDNLLILSIECEYQLVRYLGMEKGR